MGTLERKKIAFFTNSYFEQILRFGKRCKTKVTGKPTNKKYSTLSSKGPRLLSKKEIMIFSILRLTVKVSKSVTK